MWGNGGVQGRWAVRWQEDQSPVMDSDWMGLLLVDAFGYLLSWEAGPAWERKINQRTENTSPTFGALENGPAQPLSSLLASLRGRDEIPSAFYFHQAFFLGEETPTLWSSKEMLPAAALSQKITCFSLRLLVYRHVTKEATFPVMMKPMEKQRFGEMCITCCFSTFF